MSPEQFNVSNVVNNATSPCDIYIYYEMTAKWQVLRNRRYSSLQTWTKPNTHVLYLCHQKMNNFGI